jgi:hypothetical protein
LTAEYASWQIREYLISLGGVLYLFRAESNKDLLSVQETKYGPEAFGPEAECCKGLLQYMGLARLEILICVIGPAEERVVLGEVLWVG